MELVFTGTDLVNFGTSTNLIVAHYLDSKKWTCSIQDCPELFDVIRT